MSRGGNKMKYEVFYQLGNQKGIGYFSDSEIDYLKKNYRADEKYMFYHLCIEMDKLLVK